MMKNAKTTSYLAESKLFQQENDQKVVYKYFGKSFHLPDGVSPNEIEAIFTIFTSTRPHQMLKCYPINCKVDPAPTTTTR